MHTSWLLPTALLSISVSAFYPYHGRKPSEDDTKLKRFFPISPESADVKNEGSAVITMDVKRIATHSKRDNHFPVVLSNKPDLPNAMAVDQDGQDYSYFSIMNFGSKETPLYMLIDTGSATTWVMGTECTTTSCQEHNLFGPPDSKTLNVTKDPFTLTYGTGTVEGVVAVDTVTFANYTVELGFGLATQASDDFSSYPMDGILGLGRPVSNSLGTPTLMEVLDSRNELKSNIVGIHLQRNSDGTKDGQITFGGVDKTQFSGDITYTKALSSDGSWEIPVADTAVNGVSCNFTGKSVTIDTGTSFILMPQSDASTLHSLIPGSLAAGEYFAVPCGANVNVEFTFSGVTYSVGPKDYVGKVTNGNMCSSNIIGHQAFGVDQWILGDVFLKNVYAVFDFDKDRIGFATKTGSPPPSSSSSSTSAKASSSPSYSKASSSPGVSSTTTAATRSSSSSSSVSSAVSATSSPNGSPLGDTNSAASASYCVRVGLVAAVAFLVGLLV